MIGSTERLEKFFDRHDSIWKSMNQLQNEVGKLIILMSDTDNKLNMLFALLCRSADEGRVNKVLSDQQSLDKKIRLLDLLVEMHCSEEEKRIWGDAQTVFNESRAMRNIVAHQSAWINDQDPSGVIGVFLGPHSIAPKNNREATAAEIGLMCNRLMKARHRLTEVIQLVGAREGLWEDNFGQVEK